MKGTLYIVGTPIGNLDDVTLRALEVLRKVDIIACEDTRKTRVLLNKYGINAKLIVHQAHNEKKSSIGILQLLEQGKNVALVTDSGMPVISDPGGELIRLVRDSDCNVDIIPGASALTTAVSLSCITAPFMFLGFAPATPKKIRRVLRKHSSLDCPLIFYEAPHRIFKMVKEILDILGNREIIISRELTKIYQEVIQTDAERFLQDHQEIKGEIVLIILPEKQDEDKTDFICL